MYTATNDVCTATTGDLGANTERETSEVPPLSLLVSTSSSGQAVDILFFIQTSKYQAFPCTYT